LEDVEHFDNYEDEIKEKIQSLKEEESSLGFYSEINLLENLLIPKEA